MAFPGAGIAKQDNRVAGTDVVVGGESRDDRWFDGWCGVEIEISESFHAREFGVEDPSCAASIAAGIDFGFEDLGEKPEIGQLGTFRVSSETSGAGAHNRRPHGGAGGTRSTGGDPGQCRRWHHRAGTLGALGLRQ